MKKLSYLLVVFALMAIISCGEDNECVLCTQGTIETEVCDWDDLNVSVGPPGASAVQLFQNTSVAQEVATLEAAGFDCNQ